VNEKSLLLVEGKDDEHVFYSLLEHYGFPDCFQIKDCKGIENLLEIFRVQLVKTIDITAIGVIVDADESVEKRWASICSILTGAGYALPKSPGKNGTIIDPSDPFRPKVGFWIMPDNQTPGMLENFVQCLVPAGDDLLTYARECVAAIPQPRFIENHRAKAEIHTWLAWQENPGTPLGQAITKKYLDPSCKQSESIVEWLKQLFNIMLES